jgi:hypothetical protein
VTNKSEKAERASPHDALFKRTFEQVEQAAGLIQALLPPEVTAQFDIGTLEVVPGTFIDAELRDLESDLLYRVALGGRPALVYVLLEHQSSVDLAMPWRLLRYMVRIWERASREHPKQQTLPIIIPIVVAHADRRWTAATSFADLLDADPIMLGALRPHFVDFHFVLEDLTQQSSTALRARQPLPLLARLSLFLLQRGRPAADLLGELRDWVPELRQVLAGRQEDFVTIWMYIRAVTTVPQDRVIAFFREHVHLPEDVMSAADEKYYDRMLPFLLEAERRDARAAGREEALVTAVCALLTRRFGVLSSDYQARIQSASSDELQQMLMRVLDASSVDEVVG